MPHPFWDNEQPSRWDGGASGCIGERGSYGSETHVSGGDGLDAHDRAFHVVSVMQRELPSSEERAQAGAVWSLCAGRGPRPALLFSHPI